MILKILELFQKNPIENSKECEQVEKNYSKYLSKYDRLCRRRISLSYRPKYKLINLQFNDFQFRETFMIQILILFQSLKQPINPTQKETFKLLHKSKMSLIKKKIHQLLNNEVQREAHDKSLREDCDLNSDNSGVNQNTLSGTPVF